MTNKLKYFIGNWKMFGDIKDFKIINKINRFYLSTKKQLKKKKIIICVPNTLIHHFKQKLSNSSILLGAQNCHYQENYGPHTGSVSASMLKKLGAKYIILGHSDNRTDGDTNEILKKKVYTAVKQDLNVIFCVGESYDEKKKNKTFLILRKQIKSSLKKNFEFKKIMIAYEPIWSIGTNNIPKIDELKKIIKFIRNELKAKNYINILYGGSVNSKNVAIFSKIDELDGFLIGGASQSSKKFIDIVKNYYK